MIKGLILICSMHALECTELNARHTIHLGASYPTKTVCYKMALSVLPQYARIIGPEERFHVVCRERKD